MEREEREVQRGEVVVEDTVVVQREEREEERVMHLYTFLQSTAKPLYHTLRPQRHTMHLERHCRTPEDPTVFPHMYAHVPVVVLHTHQLVTFPRIACEIHHSSPHHPLRDHTPKCMYLLQSCLGSSCCM